MTLRNSITRAVRTSVRLLFPVLVVAAGAGACSKKEPDMPPVATPTVSFARDRIALGSPVNVTYRFQVAPDAKFDGDYWVFVHVLNPQGEQLWTDDHLPPVATSRWSPGQTVEYTRTIFVPTYPYIGEAAVRIGLYSQADGRRLVLAAPEGSRREYTVGKIELLPQTENVFLIYKDGWYPAEMASDNPNSEWQWTQQRATFSFRNPKKDVSFYLQYDARSDLFTPPQRVSIKVGGAEVASFTADSAEKKLVILPVSAAQLGAGELVDMAIELDRTFKPGGSDPRELGFRVYRTFIEPK